MATPTLSPAAAPVLDRYPRSLAADVAAVWPARR